MTIKSNEYSILTNDNENLINDIDKINKATKLLNKFDFNKEYLNQNDVALLIDCSKIGRAHV